MVGNPFHPLAVAVPAKGGQGAPVHRFCGTGAAAGAASSPGRLPRVIRRRGGTAAPSELGHLNVRGEGPGPERRGLPSPGGTRPSLTLASEPRDNHEQTRGW